MRHLRMGLGTWATILYFCFTSQFLILYFQISAQTLPTYHHQTALIRAVKSTNVEVACALIDAKADIRDVDEDRRSLLMIVSRYKSGSDAEQEVELVKTLLSANVSTNSVDKEGQTALMIAASKGKADIVATLVSADADTNVLDNKGRTALSFAIQEGKTEIVRILLPVDENLDIKVENNCTVVSFDLQDVDVEITELLKTNSHYADKSDCVVLPDITEKGTIYVIQALVLAGAEICTVDGGRKVLRLSSPERKNEYAY